jgi:chemotaxis protein methyltransferase CheR
MIGPVRADETERFRAAITAHLGLQFDDGKLGFLADVLQRRLDRLQSASEIYLLALEQGPGGAEIGILARELTVGETYFFRNIEQFHALEQVVLPARMRAHAESRSLRILSAGCASGEEPYSIAMTVRRVIDDPAWALDLRGGLEKAARGRYPIWTMRETPAEIQRQWFRAEGREMILDEALRKNVRFEIGNLVADDPGIWQPGTYDVIFFRNVMMYFSPAHMKAVIARMARALAPGGFLFLGHAETLRGLSDTFHLHHTHGTFYYQRKPDLSAGAPVSLPQRAMPLSPLPAYDESWADAIRASSERIAALIPHEDTPVPSAPHWDLSPTLQLFGREQFAEALASLRGLPDPAQNDPAVLLLEAILLAQQGEVAAAEGICLRLLAHDDMNAGAHYLLALCRETLGDRQGAREHDRLAIHLDPGFAMPRLHLGLLARRTGDRSLARNELGQALTLLKREDVTRLLFFGGGFGREGLIGLCESALKECGGPP